MTTPHPALLDQTTVVDRAVRDAYFAGIEVGRTRGLDEVKTQLLGQVMAALKGERLVSPTAHLFAEAARDYIARYGGREDDRRVVGHAANWTAGDWGAVLRSTAPTLTYDPSMVADALAILRGDA